MATLKTVLPLLILIAGVMVFAIAVILADSRTPLFPKK